MEKWENISLGKSGRFYPLVYLAPLPIIFVGFLLLTYSFYGEFHLLESLIIAGFGVFFLVYFFKGVEAIKITRSSIKEISLRNNKFHVHTFGGKVFEVDQFKEVIDGNDFFSKKNIRFMFPADVKNIIVRCDLGEFYISGNIVGIEVLRTALKEKLSIN